MIIHLLIYYFEAKLFFLLTEKQIKNIHVRRFRKIFQWAREHSDFYKKVYTEAGIIELEIKTESDIKKVPFVDKTMMREFKQKELLTCSSTDRLVQSRTSGSNGIPFEIYANRKEHFTSYVRTFLALSWYNPFKPFILVGTDELKEEVEKESFLYYLQKYLGLFRRQTISVLQPPVEIIESLKGRNIGVLASTPSCIKVLIDTLKKTSDNLNVKYVVLSGEVVSETLREDIQTYLRAKIINVYGCVEHTSLAWTKPNGHVFKYILNSVMFETVNHLKINGSTYGELLLTNFINKTMPLVRYKVGDHVQLVSSYKILGQVEGRIDDIIELKDGRKLFMYQMDRFTELDGITQYKILQTKNGELYFYVVCEKVKRKMVLQNEIQTIWNEQFGNYPIVIEFKDKLAVNASSGKFKRMEVEC